MWAGVSTAWNGTERGPKGGGLKSTESEGEKPDKNPHRNSKRHRISKFQRRSFPPIASDRCNEHIRQNVDKLNRKHHVVRVAYVLLGASTDAKIA